MCSRVLGRLTKHLKFLDNNQTGFRKWRLIANMVQMMAKNSEYVVDCKRQVNDVGANGNYEDKRPRPRLLDLRKAYTLVSEQALWMLLERYGLKGRCLETLMDLHETIEYKLKSWEGMREGWLPARGFY